MYIKNVVHSSALFAYQLSSKSNFFKRYAAITFIALPLILLGVAYGVISLIGRVKKQPPLPLSQDHQSSTNKELLLGEERMHALHLFRLADRYYDGRDGAPQDFAKAFKYYETAASKGFAEAHCRLGDMYYNGEGTKQDFGKAFTHYKIAADGNYPMKNTTIKIEAHRCLGDLYFNGEGVKKDNAKAFQHYKFAADQGDVEAQERLAEWATNSTPQFSDF